MKRSVEEIRENMDYVGCDNATALEMCDEIDRLQAIVDRLPKTADGVPVTPGMIVWIWSKVETPKPSPIREKRLLYSYHDWCDVQTGYVSATRKSVPLCSVYSTHEAAEKARLL